MEDRTDREVKSGLARPDEGIEFLKSSLVNPRAPDAAQRVRGALLIRGPRHCAHGSRLRGAAQERNPGAATHPRQKKKGGPEKPSLIRADLFAQGPGVTSPPLPRDDQTV